MKQIYFPIATTGFSSLQIGILIVYVLTLLGIAFAFNKLNNDSDDYFRAGAKAVGGLWE